MRYLLSCMAGMAAGAVLGVLLIALLGALSGLPWIISHADWNNNFPPVVFGAAMVMYGYQIGISVGAPIGAVVGFIVGGALASRAPEAPRVQVIRSGRSRNDEE
jgi:hypothetical protein